MPLPLPTASRPRSRICYILDLFLRANDALLRDHDFDVVTSALSWRILELGWRLDDGRRGRRWKSKGELSIL
jgi:hypothetical protein